MDGSATWGFVDWFCRWWLHAFKQVGSKRSEHTHYTTPLASLFPSPPEHTKAKIKETTHAINARLSCIICTYLLIPLSNYPPILAKLKIKLKLPMQVNA